MSPTMTVGPFTLTNTNGSLVYNLNQRDSALVKMATSNGQPIWATSWGSPNYEDRALGVVVDSKNNVVVTGWEV